MDTFIDLSLPIINGMPAYPGDESPQLQRVSSLTNDGFTNYKLCSGMHIGTHIDGPMHLTKSKNFINNIPPEHFVGKGVFLNASGEKNIKRKPQYELPVTLNSIVLLFTDHSRLFGKKEYYNDHPVISLELAKLFVEKKIKMLCIDFPSPDIQPYEIHKLLLRNNILIAENLTNLEKLVGAKIFEVIALPLKISADSSPARIIARLIK